jgi:hypothetical protein
VGFSARTLYGFRRLYPLVFFCPASESLSRFRSLLFVGVSYELFCTPARMWCRSFSSQRSIRRGRSMQILWQNDRNLQEAFSASNVLGRGSSKLRTCPSIEPPFGDSLLPCPFLKRTVEVFVSVGFEGFIPQASRRVPATVTSLGPARTPMSFGPLGSSLRQGRSGFPKHPFVSFPAGRCTVKHSLIQASDFKELIPSRPGLSLN